MPVERRNKNLRRYEPPSPTFCSSDEEERDKYFQDDPDFEFDELPQPFRHVDKILEQILDVVNDEIIQVEELNKLKRAAKKVPIFSTPLFVSCPSGSVASTTELAYLEDVCEMGHSFENLLVSMSTSMVYIAKRKDIFAIDALTNKHLGTLKIVTNANHLSLLKTVSVKVPESKDLTVSTIDMLFAFDDNGNFSVHAFNQKAFLCVWSSPEQKGGASEVVTCEFCRDANIFYVKRFSPSSGYSIEIYKIPRENWVNEGLQAFDKIELEEMEKNEDDNEEEEEEEEMTAAKSQQALELEEEKEQNALPQTSSTSLPKFSFSQLVLVTTIILPTEGPSTTSSSLYSLMKSIDLARIGNGEKHPLSAQFFNILKNQELEELKEFSPGTESKEKHGLQMQEVYPTVHFLLGIDPLSFDETSTETKTCKHDSIGIWWGTKNKFLVYNLPSSGRDCRLDAVYPNSDVILSSCVSNDTKLIALALQNGNIIMWDRLHGTPSKIVTWDDNIDYFLFGQKFLNEKSVDVLLIGSRAGCLQQVIWDGDDIMEASLTDSSVIQQSDILSMNVIQKYGWLVLVARSPNRITAFNLDSSSAICHFELPSGYAVNESPQGCIITNDDATKICVLVKKKSSIRDYEYGVFAFNLCTFDLQSIDFSDNAVPPVTSVNGLEKTMLSLLSFIRDERKHIERRQLNRWKQYQNELKQVKI